MIYMTQSFLDFKRLRAIDTIINSTMNNKIEPNQLLWAYNKLHDPAHVNYYYKNTNSHQYNVNLLKLDSNLAMIGVI